MDENYRFTEAFKQHLEIVIGYARGAERIRTMLKQTNLVAEGLRELLEMSPELHPEIGTAAESVEQLHETLLRAFTFLDARLDASSANFQGAGT